jgi:LAO/AO transport system kinase
VTCSARTGDGLDDLWTQVRAHRDALSASSELDAKRREQRVTWMWAMIEEGLTRRFRTHPHVATALNAAESRVRDGTLPATQAALNLLDAFVGE